MYGLRKSSVSNCRRLPKLVGILPLSLLLDKCKYNNSTMFSMPKGISHVMIVEDKSMFVVGRRINKWGGLIVIYR